MNGESARILAVVVHILVAGVFAAGAVWFDADAEPFEWLTCLALCLGTMFLSLALR